MKSEADHDVEMSEAEKDETVGQPESDHSPKDESVGEDCKQKDLEVDCAAAGERKDNTTLQTALEDEGDMPMEVRKFFKECMY